MANPEHLKILKRGVKAWNRWRDKNPGLQPSLGFSDLQGRDLSKINFSTTDFEQTSDMPFNCADLRGANLRDSNLESARLAEANLYMADLGGSNLKGADLRYAYLVGANLTGSDLRDASFEGANLRRAQLEGANLTGAVFGWTAVINVDLSDVAGLSKVDHIGPSGVSSDTLELTASELVKDMARLADVEIFLRGAGLPDKYITFFRLNIEQPVEFCSCFISYSHKNRPFARRVHDELQARGIRCWLDEYDLKPGERILDVVSDAIRIHDRILLCCSETSLNSWWVKDEIRKAIERERREGRDIIVPLMVDHYLLDGWEDGLAADLRARLAADFTGWEKGNTKFEEQLERVVRALRTDKRVLETVPETILDESASERGRRR